MDTYTFTGALGNDPKFTPNEEDAKKSRTTFSVAVNENRKRAEGDSAKWVSCVAFGPTAKYVADYLKKGSKVLVHGTPKAGSYVNKDGATIVTLEVIANQVEGFSTAGVGTATAGVATSVASDEIPF
jgi:single-strand DNA-binding protein